MKQATIKIKGMSCQGCVRNNERALSEAPGVKSAHVDLARGEAAVEFDEALINEEGLKQVIRDNGYQIE